MGYFGPDWTGQLRRVPNDQYDDDWSPAGYDDGRVDYQPLIPPMINKDWQPIGNPDRMPIMSNVRSKPPLSLDNPNFTPGSPPVYRNMLPGAVVGFPSGGALKRAAKRAAK